MKSFLMGLGLAFFGLTAGAGELVIERVIGSEYPGAYKHPASITELDNGDLFLAYYGGGGEYEDDSKVMAMRKAQGADAWTEPVVIADTPFLGEGNPVVWQAPDGLLWLFYVQRYGDTWSESRIKAKISEDAGATWSDSLMLTFERGTMARGRPIVRHDGKYLLPIYVETGADREHVGADTASSFLLHDPKTRSWTRLGDIRSKTGNLQAEPVEVAPNHIIAYCRRGGGYEPVDDGWLVRAESKDGGVTWSKGKNSAFKNPNAAVSFIKLQSGSLLLVYNDNMNDRTPLTVSLSEDNDATWPYTRNIGTGENTFAYPMAIQAKDGTIHVVYTTDDRKTVMLAHFDEAWVRGE